jgi:amino acid transporter
VSIAGQSLTASVVTLSVFGALTMYVMSMLSLFRLRKSEPALARPIALRAILTCLPSPWRWPLSPASP